MKSEHWTLLAGLAAGALVTFLMVGDEPAARVPEPQAVAAAPRTPSAGVTPRSGPVAEAPVAEADVAPSEEPADPRAFGDTDVSRWMDDSLDSGYADRPASGLATEQAEASLAEVPGVSLVDMQCGERFCRASFSAENGAPVDVSRLFGYPPFVLGSGGFSEVQPDGTTRIYFTRQGQSLEALRAQAQATFAAVAR